MPRPHRTQRAADGPARSAPRPSRRLTCPTRNYTTRTTTTPDGAPGPWLTRGRLAAAQQKPRVRDRCQRRTRVRKVPVLAPRWGSPRDALIPPADAAHLEGLSARPRCGGSRQTTTASDNPPTYADGALGNGPYAGAGYHGPDAGSRECRPDVLLDGPALAAVNRARAGCPRRVRERDCLSGARARLQFRQRDGVPGSAIRPALEPSVCHLHCNEDIPTSSLRVRSCGDEPALKRGRGGFGACSPVRCRSSDTRWPHFPCSEHVDNSAGDSNPHQSTASVWWPPRRNARRS